VGKPIRFRYRPEDAKDPKKVGRLHRRVVRAMQELLQKGFEERKRYRFEQNGNGE
jgi:hypothetical protein